MSKWRSARIANSYLSQLSLSDRASWLAISDHQQMCSCALSFARLIHGINSFKKKGGGDQLATFASHYMNRREAGSKFERTGGSTTRTLSLVLKTRFYHRVLDLRTR